MLRSIIFSLGLTLKYPASRPGKNLHKLFKFSSTNLYTLKIPGVPIIVPDVHFFLPGTYAPCDLGKTGYQT
ncbi:hypothetical protein DN068_05645 [Taibaiella soli]|uniref:Uncharacterized protein n=1 Tax=Taibaiella soli TaxID=1649169 RepID=A0A2W2BK44_9BACT|nr:hypothetical protein DN068_05645 [Taibaiella soli]